MNDFAALWLGIEAAPLDAAPKLVLADWLRENDRDAPLEAGLRYCAAHGKWPEDSHDGHRRTFTWLPSPEPDWRTNFPAHGRLPEPLFLFIAGRRVHCSAGPRGWAQVGRFRTWNGDGRRASAFNPCVARTARRAVWRLGCALLQQAEKSPS